MSSNVTLRGLLGLGDAPAGLPDSALVMIDCQNTYRRGVMQLQGAEDAIAEAARMLARARAAGIPVFHIMHDAGQGSPYDVTAEIGQISDEVAPIAGEPVIVKHYPSSFFETDLADQLGKTGRHDLVLTGFMTHMCVNSTARDAFNLGFRPTVVASTTATRELPLSGGSPVPAATLQTATLAGIADLFAVVAGTPDDLPG
ncbi:MAG TPA: cysteine hydrolase family protein [Streptosporangiaceae bacterium]|nr:cysteine hydrolase family protein [Streptosporangiaceae bacterium]